MSPRLSVRLVGLVSLLFCLSTGLGCKPREQAAISGAKDDAASEASLTTRVFTDETSIAGLPRVELSVAQADLDALLADRGNEELKKTLRFNLFGAAYQGTIRVHGATSRWQPKVSFRLTFAKDAAGNRPQV